MQIGTMAEDAGLQKGVGQAGVFVTSECFIPPAARLMGTAQTVVGGTHAVIQLHREGTPAGGFTGFDGQL